MSVTSQISYAERTITIPAGGIVKYDRQSDFVACLESSASFQIRINNSPASDFSAGLTFSPVGGFSSIELQNPSGTDIVATLGFGLGSMKDSRVTINSGQILPVRDAAPDVIAAGLITIVAGNAQVITPQPLQNELLLQNDSGTGATVLVRPGTTGSGLSLKDGQSLTLRSSASVNVWSSTAATVRWLATSWSA